MKVYVCFKAVFDPNSPREYHSLVEVFQNKEDADEWVKVSEDFGKRYYFDKELR